MSSSPTHEALAHEHHPTTNSAPTETRTRTPVDTIERPAEDVERKRLDTDQQAPKYETAMAEKTKVMAADNSLGSSHEGHDIEEGTETEPRRRNWFQKHPNTTKNVAKVFTFCLFTGWWIASLVLHRHDKNWIIPFLLWLAITLRLATAGPHRIIKAIWVLKVLQFAWNNTAIRIRDVVPNQFRTLGGAGVAIAAILVGTFASEEAPGNTRDNRAISLLGLAIFIFVLWATSINRKRIDWHPVIVGMLMQYIIALFVLRTEAGYDIFNFISSLARELLEFARDGVAFLTTADIAASTFFLISVLPAIVFFIALVQLLYYFRILHWFIGKFAAFFFWSMRCSGGEAVVAAASPFIGQGESALLIKPFVPYLTMAEIHQIMTSGFATIAGSVLVAYIGLGVNAQALISSCVMSIPASLAISKLRYPETEHSLTAGHVEVPKDPDAENSSNALHAFANGCWLGIKIAGMIMATQMCIIAFIALIDGLLSWWGYYISINTAPDGLTLELILGYLLYPVSFLLGVSREGGDIYRVAQLIGIKLIANEFVAYDALQNDARYADLTDRSRLIATYALCGFANLGSLGTQIGVLSQVSPSRSGDVAKVAVSALIAGAISTLTSASVAGLVVTDQKAFFVGSSG